MQPNALGSCQNKGEKKHKLTKVVFIQLNFDYSQYILIAKFSCHFFSSFNLRQTVEPVFPLAWRRCEWGVEAGGGHVALGSGTGDCSSSLGEAREPCV